MGLKITGVTANCGNDTMGPCAVTNIMALLTGNQTDVIIINCQEVYHEKQLKELLAVCKPMEDFGLIASPLMVTRTKLELNVLAGDTGIATFVIYRRSKIQEAAFSRKERVEVRGENKNKGGLLNTLILTGIDKQTYRVKTISGHLDSNSDNKRVNDWKNLKQKNAFTAKTWNKLIKKTPDLQVAGYDANTRDLWDKKGGCTNMWHQEAILDPRIANMVLAPLGSELYSAHNTYNTALTAKTGVTKDSKREGYAKAGSLDFVALQNNTQLPTAPHAPGKRYVDAMLNIGQEKTKRDHNVLVSAATLLDGVSKFERVRNYIAAELIHAAPILSQQISAMNDSETNQRLLLAIHDAYLSPQGSLIKHIQLEGATAGQSVQPWFEDHTLEEFPNKYRSSKEHVLENAFVAIEKAFSGECMSFFSKNQCIRAFQQFDMGYQDYKAKLASMCFPENTKPQDIELLSLLRTDLLVSLTQLRDLTHEPKKIDCIEQFQYSLDLLNSVVALSSPFQTIKDKETVTGPTFLNRLK